MRRPPVLSALLILGAAISIVSCGEGTGPEPVGPPALLQIVSGNSQEAVVGTELAAALVVRVVDANSRAIAGQVVNFRVTAGGGTVFAGVGITNDSGIARERWTLGTVAADSQRVEARAVDNDTGEPLVFATFAATALPGLASSLTFSAQPDAATAGEALSPAVEVASWDSYGNLATTSAVSVTLALDTAAAGAVLGGTTTVAAAAGVATFANLTINKTGYYTLKARSAGLDSAVSTGLVVAAGAAAQLAFTVQPATTTGGAVFPATIRVAVRDTLDNTVTASTANVTLAITAGTGTEGATLAGTTTRAAAGGVATFTGVNIAKAGTAYTLTASAAGLTSVTSNAFDVNVGPAYRLAVAQQPSDATAGWAMSPAVQVRCEDRGGNPVDTTGINITVAITSGTGSAGAVLGGTRTAAAAGGVASFGDLWINKVGNGYKLTATASGLTSVTSAAFAVAPGPAATLAFTAQPVTTDVGAVIAPAVQVVVRDSFGNDVPSATDSITLTITGGTVSSGATLGGTVTVAAVGGVATFADLTVSKAGSSFKLTAGATDRAAATSASFDIIGLPLRARHVAAANTHACAIGESGTTYCWARSSMSPAPVAGDVAFASLALGSEHKCGLDSAGIAYCWGYNGKGRLGDGTTTDRAEPTAVLTSVRFRSLSLWFATCGISLDGDAYCWGGDYSLTPLLVPGGMKFTSISLGYSRVCAVGEDQQAYCWAWGGTPAAVSGGMSFTKLQVGFASVCGIRTDSLVYCWGGNIYGEVGDSTYTNRPAPTAAHLAYGASDIGLYYGQTCALVPTRGVYCWGFLMQSFPNLVYGTTTPNFVSLSMGTDFGCGITSAGEVWCWRGSGPPAPIRLP